MYVFASRRSRRALMIVATLIIVKGVWMPGRRFSLHERFEIERACRWGEPLRSAARRIGRPVSTVCRDVERNGGRSEYGAWRAHRLTAERARRPKPLKLVTCPELAEVVSNGLRQCWSPQQISGRLRVEHPDDPSWWVSHETIYQSLYLQGRGGLQRELLDALRSGRTRRRPKGRSPHRETSRIQNMLMISERPAEAADRAVPGHWESQ